MFLAQDLEPARQSVSGLVDDGDDVSSRGHVEALLVERLGAAEIDVVEVPEQRCVGAAVYGFEDGLASFASEVRRDVELRSGIRIEKSDRTARAFDTGGEATVFSELRERPVLRVALSVVELESRRQHEP